MAKNMERMTKKDVCRAFGISLTALNNWVLKGCPVIKEGRNVFFSLQKIIEWKENRLKEAQKNEGDFEKARAEKELWRARTVKLNYERLSGELIPVADVKKISFESGRMTRDSILNIPARVSSILAAERDSKKVHELLTQELRQCLENLANKFNTELLQKLIESEATNESDTK